MKRRGKRISITIPLDLAERIEEIARLRGASISSIVVELVRKALEDDKTQK